MPKSVDEIKNRVMELSQKFLQLNDLLKEAVNVNDRALDIIERIKGARMGIVYELSDLQKEFELSKAASFGVRQAEMFDEVGRSISDLVEQFQQFDRQVQEQESELYDLRRERDQALYQLKDLGDELAETQEEFSSDGVMGGGWFAKALLSPRPRELAGAFSRLFENTIQDFTQMIQKMPKGDLDQLINEKSKEYEEILDRIKLAEAGLEKLKEQKGIHLEMFSTMAAKLKADVLETEAVLVKVNKYLQTSPPSYKQLYIFLLDKVDGPTREAAKKMADDLSSLTERIKITITPKQSGTWTEKLKK